MVINPAKLILDPHSPAWGDERDRSNLLVAQSIGFTLATWAACLVACVAAVFGHIVVALLMIVMIVVLPGLAALQYAAARGTDMCACGRAPHAPNYSRSSSCSP